MELQGQLLIATHEMDDDYFARSVVYICDHNEQGAMGLVLTVPTDLSISELLVRMDFLMAEQRDYPINQVVLSGGPVGQDRGFILHTRTAKNFQHSYETAGDLILTTSGDVLESFGTDDAPAKYQMFLGCATWKPDQLEQEIANGYWLVSSSYQGIIFDTPYLERWETAIEMLGIYGSIPKAGHA